MTTMIDIHVKDVSKLNTASVCEDYIKGNINEIPRFHIDKMIKSLTHNLRSSVLGDKNPKLIAYIENCEKDTLGLIGSYLKLTYYKREVAKKHHTNPAYTRKKEKYATVLINDYYESITDYCIGSIQFEGHTLDIYITVCPLSLSIIVSLVFTLTPNL